MFHLNIQAHMHKRTESCVITISKDKFSNAVLVTFATMMQQLVVSSSFQVNDFCDYCCINVKPYIHIVSFSNDHDIATIMVWHNLVVGQSFYIYGEPSTLVLSQKID
jgi:hypothetical protein